MPKRSTGSTIENPVPFIENAVYNTAQVARIIGRSVRCVRSLCASGAIRAQCDRAGFLITGWSLRNYLEHSCDLNPVSRKCKNISQKN